MRVSLVKYTGVLDFEVEELPSPYWNTIRWKLPKITDEQEAEIRDEIHSQFGPQDSSLMKEKVVEWKIEKRKRTQWYFDIYWNEPCFEEYKFEKKECIVIFDFHDGYCSGNSVFCKKSPQIISKGADVEFRLQIGNSEVLFNDLTQDTRAKCKNGSERFTERGKSVPLEICNQLQNVPRDQVSLTVFGTFPEGNEGMDLRSKFDWFTSPKPNWTGSNVADSDVTIWTDGAIISCHSNFFTRNSRVLSDLLVSPSLKPFHVHLRDMSEIQVEAFLRYQYYGVTDKILEAPVTSLGVLKAAERYETWQMWNDTMKGLLEKNSDWFEGEVARKFTNFLGKCSKREEEITKNLILKISAELRRQSPPVQEKAGNEEGEDAGENSEAGENGQVEENREAGESEEDFGCHNLDGNKIRSDKLAQLKSKLDPVSLLKFVQCYKNDEMWNDIILTLLEKDSDWFESDLALELKTFLDSCSKRDEEATRKLTQTLSKLLEQPRPIGETTLVREEEDPNGEIVENTMYSRTRRAKRKKATVENPDRLMGNINSRVDTMLGAAKVDRKLRRSARLEAGQREKGSLQTDEEPRKKAWRLTENRKKPVSKGLAKTTKRKRGHPTKDVTWTKALQVGAENARNASKAWGAGPGPRAIFKDPLLPKISIFADIPDLEVKVEKVEPPEEESENSPGMDGVEIQQVVQDQDFVAVTVKEEEPFPMDASGNDNANAVNGVIVSSWSLRQPTDENI